ncbi:NAD(P)/FAD-dependent oxidoreductase [Nostoc sp. TCL26-01]|uniref:FAD-dependent oxidoreductase n=1 Tax=Nostoc sp. TCL26-01 TaxID=2576904 RepID=UPI0015BC8E35|nr:NAD(P)/FAD-dependent oxidoreductase [Nostoc sp. TCL26-01]QLE54959.1 FAD-dependent monooxygenase [Nostoc sp. TCL26-01]
MSFDIYDVVIVGAGPVGLATALGLRKRGIENILVLDQTRAFRQVGQVLDLLPNGLKSLKYIDTDAYAAVKNAAFDFFNSQQLISQEKKTPQWSFKNLQGETIRSISLSFDEWLQDYGEGRVSIPWYVLQTTLRQQLPEDRVKANHRCIHVVDEPENECVRIDCVSDTSIAANPYAYWNEEKGQNSENVSPQTVTKSFRAKLIVAADGINSTMRRVIYQDSPYQDFAQPEYSGYAAISCRQIVDIPHELQVEIADKFLQNSPIITICHDESSKNSVGDVEDTRMMLFRNASGEYGYLIHLAVSLASLQNQSGNSLIEIALQALEKAGFANALKQLVHLSPPHNMQQRPYYIHRVNIADDESQQIQPPWSVGRVVLAGDAAHGMPPFMAQGANQGLEDAIALVTVIAKIAKEHNWDDKPAIIRAFQKYESLRRPLMAYVQQATLERYPYSSHQDWRHYSQQVYRRDFDQILAALL